MGDIKKYMIALVLFAGVMIGLLGFYGDMITSTQNANLADCTWCSNLSAYDSPISNETRLNESIGNITDKINRMREESKTFETWGIVGDFVAILKAGVDAIIIGIDSFVISQNIITEISVIIGLPAWFTLVVTTIILILLVFGLIYVVTGRDA